MTEPLQFEALQVGTCWRSPGRTITEADIVQFAGLTGDYDPLHVDHEYARSTMYRRPIAHGLLGLSFLTGLSSRSPWVKTVAFTEIREWKFVKPMFVGDTVHAITEVVEKRPRGRRSGTVVWHRRLVNQNDVIVQEGIFETLVAKEVAGRD